MTYAWHDGSLALVLATSGDRATISTPDSGLRSVASEALRGAFSGSSDTLGYSSPQEAASAVWAAVVWAWSARHAVKGVELELFEEGHALGEVTEAAQELIDGGRLSDIRQIAPKIEGIECQKF